MRIRTWYLLAALIVLLSVAACSAPATSVPPTSAPQAAAQTPTPAPVTTATSAPKAVSPTAAPTSAPTATAAPKAANPTAAPAQPTAATKSQGATTKLDIDKLLPNAPGRQETLEYCVGCHHIAAIAIAAKPKEEWQSHRLGHVGRTIVPDAMLDTIYAYLIANFPPDRVIPQLPEELLGDWTSY
ncbi:MAG: hypothetical protein HY782_10315 [Chloroflexi bacterium]|nr:hypothetical protein [Chloroflexota bacterium]